jgi:hypothetical protein
LIQARDAFERLEATPWLERIAGERIEEGASPLPHTS